MRKVIRILHSNYWNSYYNRWSMNGSDGYQIESPPRCEEECLIMYKKDIPAEIDNIDEHEIFMEGEDELEYMGLANEVQAAI